MPKIVTNTLSVIQTGSQIEAVKTLKHAGFTGYIASFDSLIKDFDIFIDNEYFRERAERLKAETKAIGMTCVGVEAYKNVRKIGFSDEEKMFGMLMVNRSIEMAKILGAKFCIVQPLLDYNEEVNIQYFKTLLMTAHRLKIKIAIENTGKGIFSNHQDIPKFIKKLNDNYACLCLNIGKAEINKPYLITSSSQIIEVLKDKVICVKFSDNNNVEEQKLLPGDGLIKFPPIMKSLNSIGYKGDIYLDCSGFVGEAKDKELDKKLQKVCKTGEKLKEKLAANE